MQIYALPVQWISNCRFKCNTTWSYAMNIYMLLINKSTQCCRTSTRCCGAWSCDTSVYRYLLKPLERMNIWGSENGLLQATLKSVIHIKLCSLYKKNRKTALALAVVIAHMLRDPWGCNEPWLKCLLLLHSGLPLREAVFICSLNFSFQNNLPLNPRRPRQLPSLVWFKIHRLQSVTLAVSLAKKKKKK